MLDLFAKLSITILAPSVLGKAVRELWPAAQRFAIKWRVELGILNTSCLAFIIWQVRRRAQHATTPAISRGRGHTRIAPPHARAVRKPCRARRTSSRSTNRTDAHMTPTHACMCAVGHPTLAPPARPHRGSLCGAVRRPACDLPSPASSLANPNPTIRNPMRAQTLSGARALLFESKATSVVTVIALASGTYLFYLALNYVVVV